MYELLHVYIDARYFAHSSTKCDKIEKRKRNNNSKEIKITTIDDDISSSSS